MITIQHHYGTSLLAKSIRLFSRGNYNHTSISVGGYVYEAHIDCGVIKTPIKDWIPRSPVVEKHNFYTDNHIIVKMWLDKQVGKKYDILGVLAFIFQWLPERKGYWYCSELAIVALQKALGFKMNNKKSPQDMFEICEALSSVL